MISRVNSILFFLEAIALKKYNIGDGTQYWNTNWGMKNDQMQKKKCLGRKEDGWLEWKVVKTSVYGLSSANSHYRINHLFIYKFMFTICW